MQLGETLDDGTTLNKYSEALKQVGIDIFDQNKQLKDMDDIILELGDKWKTLSRDQQIALAQTVAGEIVLRSLKISLIAGKFLRALITKSRGKQ